MCPQHGHVAAETSSLALTMGGHQPLGLVREGRMRLVRNTLPATALGLMALASTWLAASAPPAGFAVAGQSHYSPGVNCHSPDGNTTTVSKTLVAWRRAGDNARALDRKLAARYCLVRIDSGVMQASSTYDDVSLKPPGLYYDTRAHNYYAIAYWDWDSHSWKSEVNLGGNCCGPQNIGGYDTQAIDFNTSLVLGKVSQSQWGDWHFAPSTTTSLCGSGPYGGAVCRQDRAYEDYASGTTDMNQQHGQVVAGFTRTSDGHCHYVQAFSEYGHSWSSTAVTGVGLGAWSVSIQWSNTSNRWPAASQAGGSARVC